MWTEKDELLTLLGESNILSTKYPTVCPSCKQKTIHLYMHRFGQSNSHGSAWVWCDACRSYLHCQYMIPDKWMNLDSIDEDLLMNDPDYLDTMSASIDEHINKFTSS
jgi:hypothetical protein